MGQPLLHILFSIDKLPNESANLQLLENFEENYTQPRKILLVHFYCSFYSLYPVYYMVNKKTAQLWFFYVNIEFFLVSATLCQTLENLYTQFSTHFETKLPAKLESSGKCKIPKYMISQKGEWQGVGGMIGPEQERIQGAEGAAASLGDKFF